VGGRQRPAQPARPGTPATLASSPPPATLASSPPPATLASSPPPARLGAYPVRSAASTTCRGRTHAGDALAARAAGFVRALPDHALLDRIVRGRAWIPVLGVMLAGIVAMQVEVLKLESGIGHSMRRTSQLQTRNDVLRASVAGLADDQRIENVAARMGMVMPPSAEVGFLQAGVRGDAGKAIANIQSPNPGAFQSALSADAAAAQTATTQSGSAQTASTNGGPTQGAANGGGSSANAGGSTSNDGSSSQTGSTDGGSSQTGSTTTAQFSSPQAGSPPGG